MCLWQFTRACQSHRAVLMFKKMCLSCIPFDRYWLVILCKNVFKYKPNKTHCSDLPSRVWRFHHHWFSCNLRCLLSDQTRALREHSCKLGSVTETWPGSPSVLQQVSPALLPRRLWYHSCPTRSKPNWDRKPVSQDGYGWWDWKTGKKWHVFQSWSIVLNSLLLLTFLALLILLLLRWFPNYCYC